VVNDEEACMFPLTATHHVALDMLKVSWHAQGRVAVGIHINDHFKESRYSGPLEEARYLTD
jgi:hypothetical protein